MRAYREYICMGFNEMPFNTHLLASRPPWQYTNTIKIFALFYSKKWNTVLLSKTFNHRNNCVFSFFFFAPNPSEFTRWHWEVFVLLLETLDDYTICQISSFSHRFQGRGCFWLHQFTSGFRLTLKQLAFFCYI